MSCIYFFLLGALSTTWSLAAAHISETSTFRIVDMRTEYLREPLGLDVAAPRFSFRVESSQPRRGVKVRMYVINVMVGSEEKSFWSSGEVTSSVTQNIRYGAGKPAPPLETAQQYKWTVSVTLESGASATSSTARFSMGILGNQSAWSAKFIGMETAEPGVAPWFRKTFVLPPKDQHGHDLSLTKEAFLFVASIGFCEVTVNGQKVTEAVLSPSISYLPSRVLYNTYEISSLLRSGANNTIGLWASAGWADYMSFAWATPLQWEKAPLVMAELHIGRNVVEATDDSWECRQSNTSRLGNWGQGGFGGDMIDANLNVAGWDTPEMATDALRTQMTNETQNAAHGRSSIDWEPANIYRIAANMTISADVMEPTVKHSSVEPASISASSGSGDGSVNYTITMSELYTGWFEMNHLVGLPNGTIRFYVSSTTGVGSEFSMIDGLALDSTGIGNFRMRFSYHEIHYITVEGLSTKPDLNSITGWRLSVGLERFGAFRSSDKLLNRIYDTTINNYLGLTTGGQTVDCPHRERRGYGGDGHTSYEFALSNFGVGSYFTKWARDFADVQLPSGDTPHTAPTVSGGGGPAWSGFVVTLPWQVYRTYGDTTLLASMYPTMKKQLAFYTTKMHASDGLLHAWTTSKWDFLGDWITPHGSEDNPLDPVNVLFNNCYLHYITLLASRIAKILGKPKDAEEYQSAAHSLASSINEAFYDPKTGAYIDHVQTHLLMPLATGVVPSEMVPSVVKSFEDAVAEQNGHLDTGLTGTYFMMKYFTESGRNDILLGITNKTTQPGYGYFLAQGYTTWPENWNVKTCCSDPSSKMHGCYNSVGLWFVQGLAGIVVDHSRDDGYVIVVRAGVDAVRESGGMLSWASGSRDSPHGVVHSSWSVEKGVFSHNVTVPDNGAAKIMIPAVSVKDVKEGGTPLPVEGISLLGKETINGVAYVVLGTVSGQYEFSSKWALPLATSN